MATRQADPIRGELFFGAVYGLGLSSLIWAAVLFPPSWNAELLGLLALALALGLVRARAPFLGRFSPVLPVALSALALAGVAAGVVAAALTSLAAGVRDTVSRGDVRPRHVPFHAVTVAMAAFIAGLAYIAVGGPVAEAPSKAHIPGAILHGLAFLAVYRLLLALAATHSPSFASKASPHRLARLALAWLGSPLLALPAVAVFGLASLRFWLLISAAICLVYRLGRSGTARRDGTRLGHDRSLALRGAITRTLTKAVAAGDRDVENRLWRVQGLCMAVGDRLELDDATLEALGTAALVHDVGKIGVPEPILDKPGALTAHEIESIRAHPEFGAEMLASIALPEAVCAIVHHHHERWDGRGYPDGLQANRIPVGARVLAAVDNYHALTSPRPFRRAVPKNEARKHLRREAGKMFDPDVIDVLLLILDEQGDREPQLATPLTAAIDPPEEVGTAPSPARPPLAQQQLTALYDLERVARYPIDLKDCLRLAAGRVAALIPHRSLVVYLLDDDGKQLCAAHTAGQGADALRDVTVAVGERLSGWAVRHRRAIVGRNHSDPISRDGSRSDLEHWLDDPRLAGLGSTLAAPLVASGKCLGAVTLYDGPERDFGGDDRRRLVNAAGYIAQAVLRAGRPSRFELDGVTDRLTGLPDGRFLLLDAEERLASSRVEATELGFLAFQVSRTTEPFAERGGAELAERGLCQIARRLAAHCLDHETLARFGPDMFIVTSPLNQGSGLLERWNGFIQAVEEHPLELPHEGPTQARMVSAHAAFPKDGDDLHALLETLQDRLSLAADQGATIVPFRTASRSA